MSGDRVAPAAGRQHAFPGAILIGAQSRLITFHIPLRFFVAAGLFHVVAWLLLTVGYADVAGFTGGPGVVLAALHALTLGVLAMTAMGASYQLLGVATGVVMASLVPARLSSWLFIPGTAVLVVGMAGGNSNAMLVGGTMVVAGMAVFAAVVGDIFRRTQALKTTVWHGWAALVCLGLLAAAGLILIADFESGFLGTPAFPDHTNLAGGHAILGGFGFMGLLTMGFSYILVPMFALSPAPGDRLAKLSLGLVLAGLATAVAGALAGRADAVVLAAAIGMAGIALYLWLMAGALRAGMKKRLGLSFVMVRASWLLLPVSIILGGLMAMDFGNFNLPALFVFIMIFGWLLTFLTGILQRILPFLASMHAHRLGKRAPRLSEMGNQGISLKMHAVCHGAALLLVSVGIVTDEEKLILAGGLSGILGAAAFLWFTLGVSRCVVSFYNEQKMVEQT